jgi:hypothetical protein
MKFLDTKRASPVIYGGDLPKEGDLFHFRPSDIPKSKKERTIFMKENNVFIDREWWNKQAIRCIHGYDVPNAITTGGDLIVDGIDCIWENDDCYIPMYDLLIRNKTIHITGRYYFYLNFWLIYKVREGTEVKDLLNPDFVDLDFFFARRIELMYLLKRDNQELKGRQLGFSEKQAGMMLGYNYTFVAASINVVVGGSQDDADHTIDNTIRGLDDLINTQFYLERKRGGDRSDKIQSKKTQSMVMALTAKDNAQTVSRFSPTLVVFEEVGKGKMGWSIETASYVEASIYSTNGAKTGYLMYQGTGGSMEEGVYDLEQRTYNPSQYNILEFKNKWTELSTDFGDTVGHFSPGWLMKILDKDGNSLREEGIAELARMKKKKKLNEQYRFSTQHPIYIENVFMSSTAGYFGKDAIELLNNRYSLILNNRHLQIERQGILEFKNPKQPWDGVVFKPKQGGWLNIIEEPIVDTYNNVYVNLYQAGTDSYDQDVAETSTSKGACYIKKRYLPGQPLTNAYVAEIIERPTVEEGGASTFYLHTVMACLWYNCKNNIEYSNLRIFDFYTIHGFEQLLMQRPQLALAGKVQNTKVSNRYGTDKSLKAPILAITRETITRESVDNMFFTRQIKAMSKFIYDPSGKKYNCDITIATAETEIGCKESESLVVRSTSEEKKETYKKYIRVNGVIKPVYSN